MLLRQCRVSRLAKSPVGKVKPLPACAASGARAKSFLIVFMGNSGSTAISLDLSNHPEVYVEKLEMVDQNGMDNATEALEDTRRFFEEGARQGKVPGFKIRPKHVKKEPEKWAALMREFDTRLIWQYRKNTLKSALTSYIKYDIGDELNVGGLMRNITWEERCKTGKGCSHKVDFDTFYDRLRGHVEWTDNVVDTAKILDDGRGCVWEAPYEEYLADRDQFVDGLQRFLGIERRYVKQERWKGTSDALCEVVENWDELCEKLYGCVVWQPMLEDPKNGCYCENYTSGGSDYCQTRPERQEREV